MFMTRRIATRAIIYKEGKIFGVQQIKNGGINAYWSTPGGGLDAMESLEDGLYREMVEETGVAPIIGNLLFIQQYREGDGEQLEFFFHITNADDYMTIDLSQTTHGQLEISNFGFVDPANVTLLPDFLKTIDLETHIQSGQVKLFNYL